MKYETPELTALMPAIDAIQVGKDGSPLDSSDPRDNIAVYEDWEE